MNGFPASTLGKRSGEKETNIVPVSRLSASN